MRARLVAAARRGRPSGATTARTSGVVHVGVTRRPTDTWVAQQLREATPFGQRPRSLIRDSDSKYGPAFARVAAATGITEVRTAHRAPQQNATCERFLGSVRRECLDHVVVFGEIHLRRVLREDVAYFNQDRPHQGSGSTSLATLRPPRCSVASTTSIGELRSRDGRVQRPVQVRVLPTDGAATGPRPSLAALPCHGKVPPTLVARAICIRHKQRRYLCLWEILATQ
jgi:hypothetical protein